MKLALSSVLALMLNLFVLGASLEAQAAHINYPKYNGYGLDWCKTFENGCGKPAADLYCQKLGYQDATGFVKLNRVNFQTMTVGQNSVCDPRDHLCDSFQSIDCREKVKTIYAPTYLGYRVDWCRTFENQCGAPAAAQFCQKAGFAQLVGFQMAPLVKTPTMTVGSNAVCDPRFHRCDSFNYIQCKN